MALIEYEEERRYEDGAGHPPLLYADFCSGMPTKSPTSLSTSAINLVVVFRRFQAGKRQRPYFPFSLSLA